MSTADDTTPGACAPPKSVEDITGRRFGRLIVVRFIQTGKSGSLWLCRCDCGTEKVIPRSRLIKGENKSCGCLKTSIFVQNITKHGMSRSPEYRIWLYMIQRCHNEKTTKYHLYGGRGISVYPQWRESFEAFFQHVGPAPSPKHSIDRFPDQDGNYEPGNVRWATSREQTRNMRRNRMITIDGRTQCASDWCDEMGLGRATFFHRIATGWDEVSAVLTPCVPRSQRRMYCRPKPDQI